MSNVKKGFLKAGSIIGVIASTFLIIFGIVFFSATSLISEQDIVDSYSSEPGYNYYPETDGSYTIEYLEDGEVYTITSEEIKMMTNVVKAVLIVLGFCCLGYAVALLVMSILVLKNANRDLAKKGQIITLLVLSALMGSVLPMAFMIVALCIKDKKPTLENINEFTIEQ